MGRKIQVKKAVHGTSASGLAMAGTGSVGPTTKFSGDSKTAGSKDSGSDSFKKVGNVGQAKHKTASAKPGKVGFAKATGSNY